MLIGREAEAAAIDELLAGSRAGRSGVLVIRGEAGVGKSALLQQARAGARGMTVLEAVGVEFESELAYAALHQLLRPVLDRVERLPPPQAAALRAAFALSDETVEERFRVALGVLGLLAEVAEEKPLLCLVDDAQWLDQASADALVFAARRVVAEPLAILFAARDDPERPFDGRGLPDLRLPPLDRRDARLLLESRVGTALGPEVADWLVESANGNPLALLELPASLTSGQLAGREPLHGALLQATSVEQAYLDRVNRLPETTRSLLVLAAAEDTGDRATVTKAATALGWDVAELAVAEADALIRVAGDVVQFRHPLLRSAVYRGARFSEREQAHRALADVLTGAGEADRRAWHLAAATTGNDAEVADELERTAERARLRSGHLAAAAALERAAELTGDTDSRSRRLGRAARAAWHGGRPERAAGLLERAGTIASDPLLRADLEHLRGEIELRGGVYADAYAILCAAADAVAHVDPRKALEMLFDAAEAAGFAADYQKMADAARRAADLPPLDDDQGLHLVNLLVGLGSLWQGKTASEAPLVLDALAHTDELDEPRWLLWAASGAWTVGDDAAQAALLARAEELARASGSLDTIVQVVRARTLNGFFGSHPQLVPEAAQALELSRAAGLPNAAATNLAVLAWFAGVQGRDDECDAYAAEVGESARRSGDVLASSIAEWAVALLDLGRGRAEEAGGRLAGAVRHPYVALMAAPDLVEALVRTGRGDSAWPAIAALESFAASGAPAWVPAHAARCRALLASGTDAEREFTTALELHPRLERLFDQCRTTLLYGEFLRRERRRSDAREQLRIALDGFDRLGAEPWAERARVELRATGETARKRDPSTMDELTPQELQIARLVGEGNSNKEVAAQLFLSPRTVEYHLRKVFAKLGITSRAELIRHGIGAAREPAVV